MLLIPLLANSRKWLISSGVFDPAYFSQDGNTMTKNIVMGIYIVLMLCLISCQPEVDVIHILTDKTELAIAVEIFAGLNDDVQITLRHVPFIDADTLRENKPDLVIGDDINTAAISSLLAPVTLQASIYPALTGPVNSRDKQILFPFSFNLPVIMGRKEVMNLLPDPVVIRELDIRELEKSFVRHDKHGRLTRLGFSPSWNHASYIDMIWLELGDSEITLEKPTDINDDFLQVVTNLSNWIAGSAGSLELEIEFSERYHYLPDEILLNKRWINFARTDFSTWVTIPGNIIRDFDIRYFSGDRFIPVQSVTWGGILKGSQSSERAEDFLDWLLLSSTQKELIERWELEGLAVFGFLNGLSSIPEVNQRILLDRFPILRGMLPENHYLTVRKRLPDRWARIRDEVILPWMHSSIYTYDTVQTLSEAYTAWDLSSLDHSE